jgi:LysR family glycine cleavage system transcriptional activator
MAQHGDDAMPVQPAAKDERLVAVRLFGADLPPVCNRALAARLPEPAALARATLLRVAHAPEDWPRWMRAAGLETRRDSGRAQGPVFEYYGQAQQAAADGLGVARGSGPASTIISPPGGWWHRSR